MSEGPNYTNQASEIAEQRIHKIMEMGAQIGVEVLTLDQSKESIIDLVRQKQPPRVDLVTQRLINNEQRDIGDLPIHELVDKLLGIDVLFRWEGKTYSVDVTTAKSSGIINKQRKVESLEDTYKALGIDHALIIRLHDEVTEDTVLDLFSRLESIDDNSFTITIKYPKQNKPVVPRANLS